jgi:O-antigen/teichoic acid export membrane protein/peptidoglycan/xylan/chitin deacetylase (PgdA/CDA1 family)
MVDAAFWKDPAWRRRVRSTSLGVWGSTALAFVGAVIAARSLGPSEYGAAVLALATASLVASFLDITLEQALVHHGFRALAEDDIPGLKALIRTGVTVDLAVGVGVTLAIVALAGPLADAASGEALGATIIQLAGLNVLAGTLDPSTAAVLQIGERQELRAWAMAAGNAARLCAVVLAVAWGAGAQGIVAALAVATAVGGAVQAVFAWRVVRRRWPEPARRGGMRKVARKVLPFAVHSSLTTTMLSASTSLVPVVLGRLAGTTAVGLFRVARLPETIAALATAPFQLVMYAEMTKRATDGRAGELRRLIGAWMRIGFAIGVPAAVVGFLVLPWLIPAVYGEPFKAAVGTAQIMLIPAFIGFAFAWMKNFLAAIGRPQVATKLAIMPLLVAVPLTALLADEGSKAAAIGLTTSAVLMCSWHLLIASRWFREQSGEGERAPRSRVSSIGALARKLPRRLQGTLSVVAVWLLRASAARAGAVIAWHRVGDPPGDPSRELVPALGTGVFKAQLRHLRRFYRVVPASELPTAARARRRGQRFPVALTFDDDLASHADVVAPLLRRGGLPAMFFLTGATLQEPTPFWWERLQFAVDERLGIERRIGADDIHGAALRVVESAPTERDELIAALESISARADEGLRADAVRALSRGGLEVGFHTLRHPNLTRLGDEELERALLDGRELLAGIVGAPLRTIAYPHGRADARVAAAAREAGFGLGFTTRVEAVTGRSDPMLMGRIEAPFDSAGSLSVGLVHMLVRARDKGTGSKRRWRLGRWSP